MYNSIYRWAIILLSGYAIYSVLPIVNLHFNGQVNCPTIATIPACYLVFAGYMGILLSVLLPIFFKRFVYEYYVFVLSWLVVGTFALLGLFGENTDLWHCPQSTNGVPKCVYSAILVLIIRVLYWYLTKSSKSKVTL